MDPRPTSAHPDSVAPGLDDQEVPPAQGSQRLAPVVPGPAQAAFSPTATATMAPAPSAAAPTTCRPPAGGLVEPPAPEPLVSEPNLSGPLGQVAIGPSVSGGGMASGPEDLAGPSARPRTGYRLSAGWWTAAGVIAAVGSFLLLFNLGGYRTLTTHEGFVVVTARGMLESGDWIVPRFAGIPRLQKPPLAYWTVASSALVWGELNEWTARLPSAAAALLLSLLVGWWAGRWYGRAAGLAAAAIQMTSVYTLAYARLAEVDMLLCLLTTSAMFLFASAHLGPRAMGEPAGAGEPGVESGVRGARRRAGRPEGGWPEGGWRLWLYGPTRDARCALFWALLGLSWLAKFHYGHGLVLAAVGTYLLVQRRVRDLVRWCICPLGWIALVLCVGVWPWLLLRALPHAWQAWARHTWGRAVGELGAEPLWYYLPHLVGMTLPWAPAWMLAIPATWRRAWRGGCSRERFVWLWFAAQFAVLHLSSFKHHHYLMAALPALSLLGGRQLAEWIQRWRERSSAVPRRLAAASWLGYQAAAVVAGLAIAFRWPQLAPAGLAAALALGLGGTLITWLAARGRMFGVLYAAGGLAAVLGMITYGWILPERDPRRPEVEFARAARIAAGPSEPIYLCRLGQHPIAYYVGSPAIRQESAPSMRRALAVGRPLTVLARAADLEQLQSLGQCRVVSCCGSGDRPTHATDSSLTLVRLTPRDSHSVR